MTLITAAQLLRELAILERYAEYNAMVNAKRGYTVAAIIAVAQYYFLATAVII